MSKHVDQKTLAKRLEAAVVKSKLRQEDLARLMEIPRTAITSLIQGTRACLALELLYLCKVSGTDPNTMLGWGETPPEENDPIEEQSK